MALYVEHHNHPHRANKAYVGVVSSASGKSIQFTDGTYVCEYTTNDGNGSIKVANVKPGDQIKFVSPWYNGSTYWEVEHIKSGSQPTTTQGENVAKIYDAAVLQTKTVPAGEGVSTGVAVQEVVHIKTNFTSASDELAKAAVIGEAVAKGVNVDDPLKPIEVRLRSW